MSEVEGEAVAIEHARRGSQLVRAIGQCRPVGVQQSDAMGAESWYPSGPLPSGSS